MTPDRDPIAQTIASFVLAQTAHWIARRPSHEDCARAFARINAAKRDVFVYRFSDSGVELLPKGGFEDESEEGKNLLQVRALRYLKLFRLALSHSGQSFEGLLAMAAQDLVADSPDIPIFAFQKPAGSKLILLPDIDAISLGFYEHDFIDNVDYEDKSTSGIFIGATTGMHHTVASVAELASQRLRSGVYFRDKPEVDFRLPAICQCLSPAAEEAIRELGFGVRPGNWMEQFNSRFLLSMDGNGATCSRVAIALKSNSVLVKYASRHQLYYFDALVPYIHYVPAFADSDVLGVVRAERNAPGLFHDIAQQGSAFYRDFLSKEPSLTYTGELLKAYFGMFAKKEQPTLVYSGEQADRLDISAVAHLSDWGDMGCSGRGWIGEPGSGRAMEGFLVQPTEPAPGIPFQYRVIDESGREGDWTDAGSFVGDRGAGRRLYGFAMKAPSARCIYHGRFLDGQEVGPITDGEICQSPGGAPLEAIRIKILQLSA